MGKLVLMVFLLVAGATISLAADFSYNEGAADGPSNWDGDCKKTKQSPIDIIPKDAKDEDLGTFKFVDYNKENVKFNVSNDNGTTIKYSMSPYKFNVSGGGLPSTYTAVQFHFHWGNNSDEGSEHTMDGKFFPAEVHIVHMNIKYSGLKEALTKQDGLAVLGVFIKVGSENEDLESLLEYAENVTLPNAKVTGIPPVALMKFLPANQNEFFRYQGSLTTPPCSEAVVWTVFKDYIEISNAQLNLLRTLQLNGTTPIGKNYRPVQPLNGRTVTFSSPGEPTTPDDAATTTSAATTAKGCKLVLSTFGLLLSMLLAGIFLN